MKQIYLDHASSMPIDPRVFAFAAPYLQNIPGNPSSLHSVGLGAKQAVEDARKKVVTFVHAEKENCIISSAYTS